jgi:hypothetical protein
MEEIKEVLFTNLGIIPLFITIVTIVIYIYLKKTNKLKTPDD